MTLYDKIIKAINKSIYNALNEYNYANADHGHAGNVNNTLTLVDAINEKYPAHKAIRLTPDYRKATGEHCNLKLRRDDGILRRVWVQQRKTTSKSGNIQVILQKYGEDNISMLERPDIDEFCFVCIPNQGETGNIDNTKACFFDKEYIIDALNNENFKHDIKLKSTRDGLTLTVSERWAKQYAKEIIKYKYIK